MFPAQDLSTAVKSVINGFRPVANSISLNVSDTTDIDVLITYALSARSLDEASAALERILQLEPGNEIANAGFTWLLGVRDSAEQIESSASTDIVREDELSEDQHNVEAVAETADKPLKAEVFSTELFDDDGPTVETEEFIYGDQRSNQDINSNENSVEFFEDLPLTASKETEQEETERAEAEAAAKAEQEEAERAEAEAAAKAEQEETERAEAEAAAKAEQEETERAEAEAAAKAEQEEQERAEAAAKAEQEEQERAEAEAAAKAEQEETERAEAEAAAKAEQEETERAEAEAAAKAEQEETERAEAAAKAEQEEQERAEAEAEAEAAAKAEQEETERAEAEAVAKAEQEEIERAEAAAKAEQEEQERAEASANNEPESAIAADAEKLADEVRAATVAPSSDTGASDRVRDEKLTILTVDDSPTIRKLLMLTLEREGFNVVQAEDGVEALVKMSECNPAMILSDINMPRLDGYKLCKFVKKHAKTRHIPVIMLSGKDGVFDKLRGKMSGCDGYLTKPFESRDLLEKIHSFIGTPA